MEGFRGFILPGLQQEWDDASPELRELLFADPVAKDIRSHHRPDGEMDIRGRTGDGLDILLLTCTLEWQQRELGHRSCQISNCFRCCPNNERGDWR